MPEGPDRQMILDLFAMSKQGVGFGSWQPGNRSGALKIRASIESGGILVKGVSLFLNCRIDQPDELVSAGLTIETAYGPKCFARVDWRSRAAHFNQKKICGDLQFVDAGKTHVHRPDLYKEGVEPMEYLRQNLPAAVSLDPAPGTFSELLDMAGRILSVNNLTEVEEPQWQPRLLT